MSLDADVIVIGAGPAGCAAAIRLVTVGYKVIALERKEREDGEDITSGEVMVVPTQNECAQIGVKFEGDSTAVAVATARITAKSGGAV